MKKYEILGFWKGTDYYKRKITDFRCRISEHRLFFDDYGFLCCDRCNRRIKDRNGDSISGYTGSLI